MKEQHQLEFEDNQIPFEYVCPITHYIMLDPVITVDGHTFQRSAIETWLNSHSTNPLTNKILESTKLIPNRSIKSLISGYIASASGEKLQRINEKMNNVFKSIYLEMFEKMPHLVDDFGMVDIKKIKKICMQNTKFKEQNEKLLAQIKNFNNQLYHHLGQFWEDGKVNFNQVIKVLKNEKSLLKRNEELQQKIRYIFEYAKLTEQQQKKMIMNIMSASTENSINASIIQPWYDSAGKAIAELTVPPTNLFVHITESNRHLYKRSTIC